jgi:hypothetical protein
MSPKMAQSDVSLRVTALVAIGGIADINGRVASAKSVEIDPKRSFARAKPSDLPLLRGIALHGLDPDEIGATLILTEHRRPLRRGAS